jgi:hypothetical protein
MLGRITALFYGAVSYLAFLTTFLYAIGFVGNFWVPKSIDAASLLPFTQALAINTLLLGLFAIQHSVMARPRLKAAWTTIVPQSIERSTYVLLSGVAMVPLFWKWQPMGGDLECWEHLRTTGTAGLVSLWLVDGAHHNVSHQPFRSIRVAPSVAAFVRAHLHRDRVSYSRPIPLCPAPFICGVAADVLVHCEAGGIA